MMTVRRDGAQRDIAKKVREIKETVTKEYVKKMLDEESIGAFSNEDINLRREQEINKEISNFLKEEISSKIQQTIFNVNEYVNFEQKNSEEILRIKETDKLSAQDVMLTEEHMRKYKKAKGAVEEFRVYLEHAKKIDNNILKYDKNFPTIFDTLVDFVDKDFEAKTIRDLVATHKLKKIRFHFPNYKSSNDPVKKRVTQHPDEEFFNKYQDSKVLERDIQFIKNNNNNYLSSFKENLLNLEKEKISVEVKKRNNKSDWNDFDRDEFDSFKRKIDEMDVNNLLERSTSDLVDDIDALYIIGLYKGFIDKDLRLKEDETAKINLELEQVQRHGSLDMLKKTKSIIAKNSEKKKKNNEELVVSLDIQNSPKNEVQSNIDSKLNDSDINNSEQRISIQNSINADIDFDAMERELDEIEQIDLDDPEFTSKQELDSFVPVEEKLNFFDDLENEMEDIVKINEYFNVNDSGYKKVDELYQLLETQKDFNDTNDLNKIDKKFIQLTKMYDDQIQSVSTLIHIPEIKNSVDQLAQKYDEMVSNYVKIRTKILLEKEQSISPIRKEYQEIREGRNAGNFNVLRSHLKKENKVRLKREEQFERLANNLKNLNQSDDKAIINAKLYLYYNQMRSELKKEKNKLKSALEVLCENKMKEIKSEIYNSTPDEINTFKKHIDLSSNIYEFDSSRIHSSSSLFKINYSDKIKQKLNERKNLIKEKYNTRKQINVYLHEQLRDLKKIEGLLSDPKYINDTYVNKKDGFLRKERVKVNQISDKFNNFKNNNAYLFPSNIYSGALLEKKLNKIEKQIDQMKEAKEFKEDYNYYTDLLQEKNNSLSDYQSKTNRVKKAFDNYKKNNPSFKDNKFISSFISTIEQKIKNAEKEIKKGEYERSLGSSDEEKNSTFLNIKEKIGIGAKKINKELDVSQKISKLSSMSDKFFDSSVSEKSKEIHEIGILIENKIREINEILSSTKNNNEILIKEFEKQLNDINFIVNEKYDRYTELVQHDKRKRNDAIEWGFVKLSSGIEEISSRIKDPKNELNPIMQEFEAETHFSENNLDNENEEDFSYSALEIDDEDDFMLGFSEENSETRKEKNENVDNVSRYEVNSSHAQESVTKNKDRDEEKKDILADQYNILLSEIKGDQSISDSDKRFLSYYKEMIQKMLSSDSLYSNEKMIKLYLNSIPQNIKGLSSYADFENKVISQIGENLQEYRIKKLEKIILPESKKNSDQTIAHNKLYSPQFNKYSKNGINKEIQRNEFNNLEKKLGDNNTKKIPKI